MAQTVSVPLAGGGSILIEVDDASAGKSYRGLGDNLVRASKDSFETVVSRLKPVAEALATEFSTLARAPDSVTVEFGIKLNADADVIIAKTGGEASFCVTLSWKKGA